MAYARVNGIVPPWTVEAQKQVAENKAEQKSRGFQIWLSSEGNYRGPEVDL